MLPPGGVPHLARVSGGRGSSLSPVSCLSWAHNPIAETSPQDGLDSPQHPENGSEETRNSGQEEVTRSLMDWGSLLRGSPCPPHSFPAPGFGTDSPCYQECLFSERCCDSRGRKPGFVEGTGSGFLEETHTTCVSLFHHAARGQVLPHVLVNGNILH